MNKYLMDNLILGDSLENVLVDVILLRMDFLKRTPREFNFFSSPIFAYKIIAKYQKIRNVIFNSHLDLM